MRPSSEEIVLSWRKLPSQSEVIAKLHDFMLNLDKDGFSDSQIAEANGIHAVRFEDVQYGDETVAMLVRYNQPMRRHVVRDRVSQRQ